MGYIRNWTLKDDLNNDKKGLPPKLVRSSSSNTNDETEIQDLKGYIELNENNPGSEKDYINIVTDYAWTKSPATSRQDVGRIYLYEKRIKTNSLVSNLANSIISGENDAVAAIDNLLGANKAVADSVVSFVGAFAEQIETPLETTQQVAGVPNAIIGAGLNAIKSSLTKISEEATKAAAPYLAGSNFLAYSRYTQAYRYLYITEETGFRYVMPHFSDTFNSISNTFGNEDSGILNLVKTIVDPIADTLANVANFNKPGTYIERSKQFTMGGSGRTIEIKFPLLNTGSFDDIRSNYELLFGLIYQNRPGRVSRSAIELPVIYEVFSPGNTYMPYAYISNLNVQFLGSRRTMTIPLPTSSRGSNIITIIPDAYMVSITLQSMNEETRNFVATSIKPEITTNVTIGDLTRVPEKPPVPPASIARKNSTPASPNVANQSQQAFINSTPAEAAKKLTGGFGGGVNTGTGGFFPLPGGFPRG